MEVENSGQGGGGGKTKKAAGKGAAGASSRPLGDATNTGDRTIEQIYQKKTQLEHILLRPDTYIGSIETVTHAMWVLDQEAKRVVQKNITYVPGLYKIFDEIIVNASDNKQRDPSMDMIKVVIDQEAGSLSVWNNGAGIPVVIHKEHQIYVPELIFGNLLTGSNFDDGMKKTTGGRNGYGAKLANIFSTSFTIETADSKSGLKYRQTFRNNMTVREEPVVTPLSSKETSYTCVTFTPDFARFKMSGMDDAVVGLLSKRAYDVAGCGSGYQGKTLKVYLNGTRIPVNSFQDYLKLYVGLEPPIAFEKVNPRWEVGVGMSDGQFQQVSFVNGICTVKGGQHVNLIADQIVQKLTAVVKKKNKGQEVKGHQIKNHLTVYVNSLIENPAFDSQTKETLTTRASAFGSDCGLSDKFLKSIEKSGIVDAVVNWAKFKQDEQLKRKGGSKRTKVLGITKLDDANYAGTAKSSDCTLILTEGDSAKTLAITGLSVVGRDYFGVFPLRGKPLNVREAAHAQIMKNEEIQNIVKIMGLRFGTVYTDTKSLRYGHLMIMTDQDHDGSHIKGLLINLLHHFWPSLLQLDGFLQEFITPIVKCSKGKRNEVFYTIPEYEAWKADNHEGMGWTIKYYKGLGTSTANEAKEYFSDLVTHRINFIWRGDEDGDLIDMAFAKKRVEDRKDWLKGFTKGTHVDYKVENMTYDAFINQELVLFSMADNLRSIPSIMDGLKPSQRKVLFACFKRNLRKEIKVAQLAGYVSEHSAYHHGEASLNSTIVGMAQNFVGSNNINFLYPAGQFGTRIMGGKDAASARYIFTRLEEITRSLFHIHDDPLLAYLEEDGQRIEPEYYVPIIPTVLVNGSDGIGTGWSSSIPTYNPLDIIQNIKHLIKDEIPETMHPWYRGFTGKIEPKAGRDTGSYLVTGTFRRVDDVTIEVIELPVKRWTQDYKQFMESMTVGASDEKGAFVKDFKEKHTDTSVYFVITLAGDVAPELLVDDAALLKRLKLEASISTSNMHLFNVHGEITKYDSPNAVLQDFFPIRMDLYDKRRASLLRKLDKEWRRLDNKVRFILSVVGGQLVVSNRKKAELLQDLARAGYELFDPRYDREDGGEETEAGTDDQSDLGRGYDYLLSMKIWNLTLEKVEELREQLRQKQEELDELRKLTPADLWLRDLEALEVDLTAYNDSLEIEPAYRVVATQGKSNRGKAKPKPKAKTKRVINLDSDEEDEMSLDEESEDSDYRPSPAKKAPNKRPAAVPKPAVPSAAAKLPPKAPAASKATGGGGGAAKGGKKAPAAKPAAAKDVDEEDDVEVVSLAERMRARMQMSPAKADPEDNMGGGDDIFESPAVQRKKPAAKGGAGGTKRAAKGTAAASRTNATLFSPDKNLSPAVVKKPRTAAASKPKPAAKPKAAAAKPAPKKGGKKKAGSDSEEEEEDFSASGASDIDVAPREPRSRRAAAQKVTYINMDDDEDDDDEDAAVEEEEEEDVSSDEDVVEVMAAKPAAKPAAKAPAPKPAAAKKPAAPKKKKADSSDEEEEESEFEDEDEVSEEEVVVSKARKPAAPKPAAKAPAPKPAAAKKPAAPKRKKAVSSDEEEEEESEFDEESEEEDDDDDSDFSG